MSGQYNISETALMITKTKTRKHLSLEDDMRVREMLKGTEKRKKNAILGFLDILKKAENLAAHIFIVFVFSPRLEYVKYRYPDSRQNATTLFY